MSVAPPSQDPRAGVGPSARIPGNLACRNTVRRSDRNGYIHNMFAAVDIGNSRVKCACFEQERIVGRHRLPTDACVSSDLIVQALRPVADARSDKGPLNIGFASVVPRVSPLVLEAAARIGANSITEVRYDCDLGLEVAVNSPATIGPDRLANAVAAVAVLGAPVVVVDFGTAITTTVVSEDRRLIGGSIGPGVRTSARALAAFTGRLPEVQVDELCEVPPPIGDDTIAAIRSGVVLGAIGAVRELLRRISLQLGGDPPSIATGGMAPLLAPHAGIAHIDTDLTFRGIREVAIRAGIQSDT